MNQVIAAKYVMGTSYTLTSGRPLQMNTLVYDTTLSATYGVGVTFTYVVPISGYYDYMVGLQSNQFQAIGVDSQVASVWALRNGTSFLGSLVGIQAKAIAASTHSLTLAGMGSGYFNAGDTLAFNLLTGGASYSLAIDTALNYLAIERRSGAVQANLSNNSKSSYNSNAGQSIANAATPIVDFEDVIYDTFGSVTTGAAWKFTAPRSGKLSVKASIVYASAVFTNGTNVLLLAYKNGVLYKKLDEVLIQAAVTITDTIGLNGTCDVNVNAGDTVDIRTSHGESAGRSLSTVATENYCDIAYWDGF